MLFKTHLITMAYLPNTLHYLLHCMFHHFFKLLCLECLELFHLTKFSFQHSQVSTEC